MGKDAHDSDPRPVQQSRAKYFVIAAAALAIVLIAGWLWLVFVGTAKVPDLGGGLTIQADPDARILVGARSLGPGQAYVSWSELLADRDSNPMAVERAQTDGPVTAETLAGPGAKVLHKTPGGGGGCPGLNVDSAEWLLRRPDGTLDHLWALSLDWTPSAHKQRRILMPVRIRGPKGKPAVYYLNSGSSSGISSGLALLKLFGRPPTTADESWRFTAGNPPAEFAEEIKNKGLWEPAAKE